MGEIFARPVPVIALPFTGERLTSEFGGQTEMEHLHRYMLARHLCRGRDVLDIASGEGYGAALLGQVASSVIGVEVAEDAVAHATANYVCANLCFRLGDARRIPLDDASVDVVVSFETIEHFDEQETFLAEVRRVLRPGGKMIVSTPERDSYSPADRPANPYHVMELTREEFVVLLNRHFRHVTMLWQRSLVGTALLPGPEANAMPETLCFERRGDAHFEMSTGYARPQYLVAVCSDVPPPPLPPSIYIDTSNINAREDQSNRILASEQVRVAAEVATEDALRRATAAEAASQAAQVRTAAAEVAAEDALRRATAAEAASQAAQVRTAAAEVAAEDALRRATAAEAASQADQVRTAAAEVATEDALRRANAAEAASRADQVRTAAAEVATEDALRRATAAEACSDRLRSEINALRHSISWRLTSPLRAVGRLVYRRKG
jgi:SAM-dependent methyltransferase